jgi:hypothetical protein
MPGAALDLVKTSGQNSALENVMGRLKNTH